MLKMYKDASRDIKYLNYNVNETYNPEFYSIPEVRNLLNNGYLINFYSDLSGTNYVMFVKDAYIDTVTYMLDECVTMPNSYTYADFTALFPGIEDKYDEGYEESQKYENAWNVSPHIICGVSLTKKKLDGLRPKQDSLALGAHGEERGVAEFPEYGSFVVQEYNTYNEIEQDIYEAKDKGYEDPYYIDFELNQPSYWRRTLNGYQAYLESLGIDVAETSLLAISDLNNIALKTTGKELPLEEWTEAWGGTSVQFPGHDWGFINGSLIDNIPEKYSWLWSTTYWTRTTTRDNYVYFVDIWGDTCSAHYCDVEVGAGLRPVITLAKEDIIVEVEGSNEEQEQPPQPNPETQDLIAIALSILVIAGGFIVIARSRDIKQYE